MKKGPSLPRVSSPLHEAEKLPEEKAPEVLGLLLANMEGTVTSYNMLMELYEKHMRESKEIEKVKYLFILAKDTSSPELFQHLPLFSLFHGIRLYSVQSMWRRKIEEETGRKNVLLIGVRESHKNISQFDRALNSGS
jgi:hypothetical protein